MRDRAEAIAAASGVYAIGGTGEDVFMLSASILRILFSGVPRSAAERAQ